MVDIKFQIISILLNIAKIGIFMGMEKYFILAQLEILINIMAVQQGCRAKINHKYIRPKAAFQDICSLTAKLEIRTRPQLSIRAGNRDILHDLKKSVRLDQKS